MTSKLGWQFWIDRGGTFTDIVARKPEGELVVLKLLSENKERYRDAAMAGIRMILGLQDKEPLPSEVTSIKMGTTVATNALLERKGESTILAITQGFGDALRIAYQNRPKIFARKIVLPELLYREVVEIEERVDAKGNVLCPLNEKKAREAFAAARARGYRAIAIALMHGYRYQAHELRLAEIARELGFLQISVSHLVSPLIKLVGRGDTTIVDAYLSPILRRYVDQVAEEIGQSKTRLFFMQSNGGLAEASAFHGKDSILSGPAGGIVGAVETARLEGAKRIIGFDMGGTSTDVWHWNGAYERRFDAEIAGVRIRAPMLEINTVAAGGGSILDFDGARMRAGPHSAGADPGPASYRRDGPLTVTDCNVLLGRLNPEFFPRIFGKEGDLGLDKDVVVEKFRTLSDRIAKASGKTRSIYDIAEGYLKIATANMANAIKEISVQRGYDVSRYWLVCFGGAGGQHACRVADELGMTQIFLHPLAGVLSAYGMGLADMRSFHHSTIEKKLDTKMLPEMETQLRQLEDSAVLELKDQGVLESAIMLHRHVHIKYAGADLPLMVPFGDLSSIRSAFESLYRQRYGFILPEKAIVADSISVEAVGVMEKPSLSVPQGQNRALAQPSAIVSFWVDGKEEKAPVFDAPTLAVGQEIVGPAILIDPSSTTIVEPGWVCVANPSGSLSLRRQSALRREWEDGVPTRTADPVKLEIFNNRFMSIAEQMGSVLEKTSHSVNIKERLDFSCALFDDKGALIANAPHVPVHLGSMGDSVEAVIQGVPKMRAGDSYVLNAPYNGGTHLPDITVVTPAFDAKGEKILFYVASRGHHADIGGISPGSMPPDSRVLEEEGILIDCFKLVDQGRFCEQEIRTLLGSGKYPARNIDQNIADLKAQIAAGEKGVTEIRRMIEEFGIELVHSYMQHVKNNAAEEVRRVIDRLEEGAFSYEMDDGAVISLRIEIDRKRRHASIDFSGTSKERSTNFNAPRSVVKAAVLYAFRTMVDNDIPLNAGCLEPITIKIPDGTMLSPQYPAAIVAGNVETSQVVTDALFGAMGVMAASQGTMNNFTFGDATYQYYETIAGGSGAGPDFDGTDAVQTHMTNSRLTDPEVLEQRFPVLIERFAIRKGSGGNGAHRGGNGAIRAIRFLQPMMAAILSGHRRIAPYGMKGGEAGKPGRNWVRRLDGSVEELAATAKTFMKAGDCFIIETPGGGGFGRSGSSK